MKFYEFNTKGFSYYALIGANTMEDAIKEYTDNVCDIEEDEKESKPTELTREQALKQYIGDMNKEHYSKEFDKYTKEYNPCLLLVDSSLM